jgi:hypothetical protein
MNIKTDDNPNIEILWAQAAHGNRNVISKSKIINKIDIR